VINVWVGVLFTAAYLLCTKIMFDLLPVLMTVVVQMGRAAILEDTTDEELLDSLGSLGFVGSAPAGAEPWGPVAGRSVAGAGLPPSATLPAATAGSQRWAKPATAASQLSMVPLRGSVSTVASSPSQMSQRGAQLGAGVVGAVVSVEGGEPTGSVVERDGSVVSRGGDIGKKKRSVVRGSVGSRAGSLASRVASVSGVAGLLTGGEFQLMNFLAGKDRADFYQKRRDDMAKIAFLMQVIVQLMMDILRGTSIHRFTRDVLAAFFVESFIIFWHTWVFWQLAHKWVSRDPTGLQNVERTDSRYDRHRTESRLKGNGIAPVYHFVCQVLFVLFSISGTIR